METSFILCISISQCRMPNNINDHATFQSCSVRLLPISLLLATTLFFLLLPLLLHIPQ